MQKHLRDTGYHLLQVEDDENDALLLTRVLSRLNAVLRVHSVPDAEGAVAYLEKRSPYLDNRLYPRPGVIFLDLTLPRMTGIQFLQWKAGSAYRDIPVIAFTGSIDLREHNQAVSEGALTVCTKPLGLEALARAVSGILSLRLAGAGQTGHILESSFGQSDPKFIADGI